MKRGYFYKNLLTSTEFKMINYPGRVDHTPEHSEEKYHEAIAEGLAFHPARHIMPA